MIVGAPKAGNVWLKHLISDIYNLPMVDVSGLEDPRVALTASRFITHQHILPRKDFVGWGQREQVQFITLARHPGDLFLSLYHYVQNFGKAWQKAGILGSAPCHIMHGKPLTHADVTNYLAQGFHSECLGKSLMWVQQQHIPYVRYEDLKAHGLRTLAQLTSNLEPVSEERLVKALEKRQFSRMKRFAGWGMKRHFRSGKTGEWQYQLNANQVEIIARTHRECLERFSYNMTIQQLKPGSPEEPGSGQSRFAKWFSF